MGREGGKGGLGQGIQISWAQHPFNFTKGHWVKLDFFFFLLDNEYQAWLESDTEAQWWL